jgi:hypothetical protein
MAKSPVAFDVGRPEKFERPHVFLRILILIILSALGGVLGWVTGLVYLVLPALAAIFVSQRGPERFLQEDGPRMTGWLRWFLAFYAYIGLLTDRFPIEKPEEIVRFEVQASGRPTVGSALLRLILSIPSAFVLALLGILAAIVWLIALILVLIRETYPENLHNFQRGLLRWAARLLAYHASLIDQYPPFALDTGSEAPPPVEQHPPSPPETAAEPPPAVTGRRSRKYFGLAGLAAAAVAAVTAAALYVRKRLPR